ncbi:thermonuclease family protein [Thermaerobacter litoralis]
MRKWVGLLVLAGLLLAVAGPLASQDTPSEAASKYTKAVVVRVVDGDTIDVRWVSGPRLPSNRIRMIGVNTPESTTRVEPYGKEAAAFTKKRLQGRTVWLEKDVSEKDRYGRALRYVWLKEPPAKPTSAQARQFMFNAILVAEGYAQVATFPPDVKWTKLFVDLQREARAKGRGLWRPAKASVPAGAVKGSGGYSCPRGYPVKGNIASSGEKIYHVPGGAYYAKTKPEYCFRTAADAQRAGFRPSSR